MELRLTRRVMGMVAARLAVLPWQRVSDPRVKARTSWTLATILQTVLVGLLAGAQSVAQLEALTSAISGAARRWLELPRRLADTTIRDVLVRLVPDELRALLHAQVRKFKRQKAIEPEGFRWGVVSMDGRATCIRAWDKRYAQQQKQRGLLRTVTASLVSTPGCPCIDAWPIAPSTNEMGCYLDALRALVATYKSIDLFRVVMYDAGACSEANARGTRDLGLHYVMQLNDAQPTLLSEACRLLVDVNEEVIELGTKTDRVRYRIKITEEMSGFLEWDHLRTLIHIHRETLDRNGAVRTHGDRYFITSLRKNALTTAQWARIIKARWGVENNCHHTFDTVFAEDERPWFQEHPTGALNVMILRRIAYNILAIYRARTLRSEANRLAPWRDLIRWTYNALISATEEAVNGLRARARPDRRTPATFAGAVPLLGAGSA